jgi:hypothetical protein
VGNASQGHRTVCAQAHKIMGLKMIRGESLMFNSDMQVLLLLVCVACKNWTGIE